MMTDSITLREREQQRLQSQSRSYQKQLVKEAILECAPLLNSDNNQGVVTIGKLVNQILRPILAKNTIVLSELDNEFNNERRWNWTETYRFIQDPYKYLGIIENYQNYTEREVNDAMNVIISSYYTYELLAENKNLVDGQLTNSSPVYGFSEFMGEFRGGYDIDLGDSVKIVDETDDQQMTVLNVGKPGQGKSVGVEAMDYDRYSSGYKIFDLTNLTKGEGLTRDIPQGVSDLTEVRKDMGAEIYDEIDTDIQILAPLTPELADHTVTKRGGELEVTPFTLPASSLSKSLLISLMMSLLGKGQQATISDAWNQVNVDNDDWTMKELAHKIRSKENLGPKLAERAVSALRIVNQSGFIRDKECEYKLDLDEIMRDKDTATILYTGHMNGKTSKFMVVGAILSKILELRDKDSMNEYPPMALTARELWKICPHSKRSARDSRAESLQSVITGDFQELLRMARHLNIDVLADTQESNDLNKSIREMFNQYVIYNATRKSLSDMVEWAGADKPKQVYNTLRSEPGVATILGRTEPTVTRQSINYVAPVKICPAPYHHLSTKNDGSGWGARAKHHDDIELTTPREFGADWVDDTEQTGEYDIDGMKKSIPPHEEFVRECFEHTGGRSDKIPTQVVRNMWSEWAAEHETAEPEIESTLKFGTKFSKAAKEVFDIDNIDNETRQGKQQYIEFVLTFDGEVLAEKIGYI